MNKRMLAILAATAIASLGPASKTVRAAEPTCTITLGPRAACLTPNQTR